jgi:hypothetical protein
MGTGLPCPFQQSNPTPNPKSKITNLKSYMGLLPSVLPSTFFALLASFFYDKSIRIYFLYGSDIYRP